MKLSNNINSDPGFSYEAVINSQRYIIRSGITHPCLFSLRNIATMSGITAIIVKSGTQEEFQIISTKKISLQINNKKFSWLLENILKKHTSFFNNEKMKVTMMKGNVKLFFIECYMPSYQSQNVSVCKQHAHMFKDDNHVFHPQKDLVLFMPYMFVHNLKPGQFTPLDKQWLMNLNGILKKAKSNPIKQIRVVRLLKTNYFGNCSITLRNSIEDVTYEVFININGSSFLVNLGQVYDIVGEED
jgi:hypothetical protein